MRALTDVTSVTTVRYKYYLYQLVKINLPLARHAGGTPGDQPSWSVLPLGDALGFMRIRTRFAALSRRMRRHSVASARWRSSFELRSFSPAPPRSASCPTGIWAVAAGIRRIGSTTPTRMKKHETRKAGTTRAICHGAITDHPTSMNGLRGHPYAGDSGDVAVLHVEAGFGAVADLDIVRRALRVAVASTARGLVMRGARVPEAARKHLVVRLRARLAHRVKSPRLELVRLVHRVDEAVRAHAELRMRRRFLHHLRQLAPKRATRSRAERASPEPPPPPHTRAIEKQAAPARAATTGARLRASR